ncbi:MAG: cysteine--tRNA ligase, partial [Candidatus Saliniplasma sp.]
MTIKLYNTLTGEKEVFEPSNEGKVKLYSCGQTIYEDMHVGNAKTYAAWDILNRYLTWKGYDVFHVMNITDVGHLTDDADQGEDKVEKAAKEKRLEPMELVTKQVRKWYREMDSLNMKVHNVNPRATGHMVEMIEFV